LEGTNPLHAGLACTCPRCGKGKLFSGFLKVAPTCPVCGLDLSAEDSGDGPAVFLIFILGFTIAPVAVIFGLVTDWPVWVHAVLWSVVTLAVTLGLLRPSKALVIALQYHHRRQGGQKL
jgi:uncharacterized protein (DUF983 family)